MSRDLVERLLSDEATVDYVKHFGPRCRDCADEDGICPTTGIGCGKSEQAIRHIFEAVIYGLKHRFLIADEIERLSKGEVVRTGRALLAWLDRFYQNTNDEIPEFAAFRSALSATPPAVAEGMVLVPRERLAELSAAADQLAMIAASSPMKGEDHPIARANLGIGEDR